MLFSIQYVLIVIQFLLHVGLHCKPIYLLFVKRKFGWQALYIFASTAHGQHVQLRLRTDHGIYTYRVGEVRMILYPIKER